MLDRVELLIDNKQLDLFINSNILLVGVGGVGGACFEALVRMGLKNISIVDYKSESKGSEKPIIESVSASEYDSSDDSSSDD